MHPWELGREEEAVWAKEGATGNHWNGRHRKESITNLVQISFLSLRIHSYNSHKLMLPLPLPLYSYLCQPCIMHLLWCVHLHAWINKFTSPYI